LQTPVRSFWKNRWIPLYIFGSKHLIFSLSSNSYLVHAFWCIANIDILKSYSILKNVSKCKTSDWLCTIMPFKKTGRSRKTCLFLLELIFPFSFPYRISPIFLTKNLLVSPYHTSPQSVYLFLRCPVTIDFKCLDLYRNQYTINQNKCNYNP
jgi:hypothetical protein